MFLLIRVMNVVAGKEQIMVEKGYKLYGTKILNLKTQEIGLLICLWENKFADKTVDCLGFLPRSQSFAFMPHGIVRSICSLSGRCRTEIRFATCVDKTGKCYNIELDNIREFEDDFYKANQRAECDLCEPVSVMERSEMKVKNKLTKEPLDIPYSEFRIKFSKEIQDAFESYRKTQLNKYSWNFKDDNSLEFNFYFELQWNFNNFGLSNWYIERI